MKTYKLVISAGIIACLTSPVYAQKFKNKIEEYSYDQSLVLKCGDTAPFWINSQNGQNATNILTEGVFAQVVHENEFFSSKLREMKKSKADRDSDMTGMDKFMVDWKVTLRKYRVNQFAMYCIQNLDQFSNFTGDATMMDAEKAKK